MYPQTLGEKVESMADHVFGYLLPEIAGGHGTPFAVHGFLVVSWLLSPHEDLRRQIADYSKPAAQWIAASVSRRHCDALENQERLIRRFQAGASLAELEVELAGASPPAPVVLARDRAGLSSALRALYEVFGVDAETSFYDYVRGDELLLVCAMTQQFSIEVDP